MRVTISPERSVGLRGDCDP